MSSRFARGMIVQAELESATERRRVDALSCLVIQNDIGNIHSPTTIVAAVEPAEQVGKLSGFTVALARGTAGLSRDSVVLCDQIRSIPQDRLGRVLGRLDAELMQRVDEALKISLGL